MHPVEKLTQRKTEILREIARLEPMRRGSVTEQFLTSTRRDGSKRQRGPYTVYSFKPGRKTASRRLRSDRQRTLSSKDVERVAETMGREMDDWMQRHASYARMSDFSRFRKRHPKFPLHSESP